MMELISFVFSHDSCDEDLLVVRAEEGVHTVCQRDLVF